MSLGNHTSFFFDRNLKTSPIPGMTETAYYYPAPYWTFKKSDWIKSLLLFFDDIAILLPNYMHGQHTAADPTLAEPLEDRGLLRVLEPNDWVDQEVTGKLAETIIELLETGVFDDLPKKEYFAELSQSRIGYGADVKLANSVVAQLVLPPSSVATPCLNASVSWPACIGERH